MAKPGPKPGDYSFYWYEMGERVLEHGRQSASQLADWVVAKHRLKLTLVGTLRKGFPEFIKSEGMSRPKPLDPRMSQRLRDHFESRAEINRRGLDELEKISPLLEELEIDPALSSEQIRERLDATRRQREGLDWTESSNREATLAILLDTHRSRTEDEARGKLQELIQEHQALARLERVLGRFLKGREDADWRSFPEVGKDTDLAGKDP